MHGYGTEREEKKRTAWDSPYGVDKATRKAKLGLLLKPLWLGILLVGVFLPTDLAIALLVGLGFAYICWGRVYEWMSEREEW